MAGGPHEGAPDILEGQFRLLSEAYDFDPPPRVSGRYMIASTPRSGSTMLSMRLWRTGRLGAPLEYFNFANVMPKLQLRFGSTSLDAYMRMLARARTSPNGVFGFKAHWTHIQFMLIAGLWTTLRPERIVRVRRRDRLAQAVSLTIATQTGRFSSLDGESDDLVYDPAQIQASWDYIERSEAAWDGFLEPCGADLREVDYDDLREMDDVAFKALAEFLSPDAMDGPTLELPAVRSQSSARNAEWVERFRTEEGGE